jgi:hypothetical protein
LGWIISKKGQHRIFAAAAGIVAFTWAGRAGATILNYTINGTFDDGSSRHRQAPVAQRSG